MKINCRSLEYDLKSSRGFQSVISVKCAPGTTRNPDDKSACVLCPVGTYWVESMFPFLGQCALCPPGFSTAREGATGFEACTGKITVHVMFAPAAKKLNRSFLLFYFSRFIFNSNSKTLLLFQSIF